MESIDSKAVFDLVHDYLIHSGFVGALHAFENESSFSFFKNDKEESQDVVDDMQQMLVSTNFSMQRKNTLGPNEIIPLSARSNIMQEVEIKHNDTWEVSHIDFILFRVTKSLKK